MLGARGLEAKESPHQAVDGIISSLHYPFSQKELLSASSQFLTTAK